MQYPYLPVTFDEVDSIQHRDFVDWPSQRIRILGNLSRTRKRSKRDRRFLTILDEICLKSVGESKNYFIPLDFR